MPNLKIVDKAITIVGIFAAPILYWSDCMGPDGKPSNSKIMYFMALVVALISLLSFGQQSIATEEGLSVAFVFYSMLVLSFAGGHDLFKAFLKKQGNVADALSKINERRNQAAADGNEGTEPTN